MQVILTRVLEETSTTPWSSLIHHQVRRENPKMSQLMSAPYRKVAGYDADRPVHSEPPG